jgi:hypothetical protein
MWKCSQNSWKSPSICTCINSQQVFLVRTLRACSQSVLVLANKLFALNYLTAKKDAWSKFQWCKMMPMPVIKPQTKCQEASLEYGTNGTTKASNAFWAQGFGQNKVSLPVIGFSANCISFAIPVLFHKSNYIRRARETPRTAPQARRPSSKDKIFSKLSHPFLEKYLKFLELEIRSARCPVQSLQLQKDLVRKLTISRQWPARLAPNTPKVPTIRYRLKSALFSRRRPTCPHLWPGRTQDCTFSRNLS